MGDRTSERWCLEFAFFSDITKRRVDFPLKEAERDPWAWELWLRVLAFLTHAVASLLHVMTNFTVF
jgi:hypothetical protein